MRVLAMVLAGGKGTHLYPLTKECAQPAIPFGGTHRVIDFALSNLINSGVGSIYVLVQFKSQSLLNHMRRVWVLEGGAASDFVIPVPAQMRTAGEQWYLGTADAIYQNINLIEQSDPHVVIILDGGHVSRMNVAQMIEFHNNQQAAVTLATCLSDPRYVSSADLIEAAPSGELIGIGRMPPGPATLPVYASTGNYVFSTQPLLKELYADAANAESSHDFARDILPEMLRSRRSVFAYDLAANRVPGEVPGNPYWRDLGTIEAYYAVHMELCSDNPAIRIYNPEWPLRTASYRSANPDSDKHRIDLKGDIASTIVSLGCRIYGRVRNSILGPNVRVHEGACVEDSVLYENCDIGRRAKIRRAIIGENVRLPEDATIGFDLRRDREYHHVSESDVVIVEGRRTLIEVGHVAL